MPSRRSGAEPQTPPRELRPRGQRTRDRLLESGATVFADRGYHAARVDDIVKLAKASHGTFYLYFANKEALFHALAEQIAQRLESLAVELPQLRPGADGLAALTAWMTRFQEMYDAASPILRAWTEAEIVASDVGKLATTVWAAFTRALMDRIRETAVDGLDPAVAALALVAMIERANYYVITGQVGTDGRDIVHTLARVTHAAIFGKHAIAVMETGGAAEATPPDPPALVRPTERT